MMLKSGLLVLLGTLSIASSAATINMKTPDTCPRIAAIQSEGVSLAYELAPKVFFALQKSTYHTKYTWFFAIGFFEADSQEDAVQNGNKFLAKLTDSTPPFYDDEGYWVCSYKVAETDLTALAFYADQPFSPLDARHLLKKAR